MLIQLAYQHLSALPELNFRLQQLEKHKLPKGEFRDCASPHEPQDYESGLGEDLEITQKMWIIGPSLATLMTFGWLLELVWTN